MRNTGPRIEFPGSHEGLLAAGCAFAAAVVWRTGRDERHPASHQSVSRYVLGASRSMQTVSISVALIVIWFFNFFNFFQAMSFLGFSFVVARVYEPF